MIHQATEYIVILKYRAHLYHIRDRNNSQLKPTALPRRARQLAVGCNFQPAHDREFVPKRALPI